MFTPYMEEHSPQAAKKLREVKHALKFIPNVYMLPSGKELSCHAVCRVLSKMLDLQCHDGYFGGIYEHSWLTWQGFIIDPYPIGLLYGPIILDIKDTFVWRKLYKEAKLDRVSIPEFEADLKALFHAVNSMGWGFDKIE